MKKIFKKSIAIAAALSLAMTGCGSSQNAAFDDKALSPSAQVADSDKVTFDWYINYSWFNTKWGDNAVSKEITNKTGVNINFITIEFDILLPSPPEKGVNI